jgi:hypothetical protein
MALYTIEAQGRPVLVTSAEDIREIKNSLDTWLGYDLETLEYEGRPIWEGDDQRELHIRESLPEEVTVWNASQENAVRSGKIELGEDWLTFLVPVTDSSLVP